MARLMIHGYPTTGSFSSADKIIYDDTNSVKDAINAAYDDIYDLQSEFGTVKTINGTNCNGNYCKIGKTVILTANVLQGGVANSSTLFTIPAGYRPIANKSLNTIGYFPNKSTCGRTSITVFTNGNVTIGNIDINDTVSNFCGTFVYQTP